MSYKKSGVDVNKTNAMIRNIKYLCGKTKRKEVIGNIGQFSGFFRPDIKSIKDPILVASTDGVGTKLMIAQKRNNYSSIGIDLVAMCVNDIITCGAEPLFFLDYFATGKVKPNHFFSILKGIVTGCKQSHCALIGGEIAEMPRFYNRDKFDIAGFCVGIIDKNKIMDGTNVRVHDVVLGIASSGLHSNGYSLARRLFTSQEIKSSHWGSLLMKPTIIYTKPILHIAKKICIHATAHITGGGLYDNIPRVIPKNKSVVINSKAWNVPRIFNEIKKRGNINEKEMYRTFNMGIGMITIISNKAIPRYISHLNQSGIVGCGIVVKMPVSLH